jgi:hypothetical protein
MKSKLPFFLIVLSLLASLIQIQTARAVVAFTVTPATVSNTYSGMITLTVTGLTNTEKVVVQKFLDSNTNGIVDGGDLLWQQFNLTDGQPGMVIGGVTNSAVPGDTDGTVNGTITAKLTFQFAYSPAIAGNYLFRLSSPVSHFTALTVPFTVTNFAYAQKFTGTVASGGVAVPNAAVLLFQGSGDNLNPIAGAVANNAGVYTLPAPAGTYLLAAFKSNYVADTTVAANLVLASGVPFSTNLNLIAGTQTISGKIVDTNSGAGLPGMLMPFQTQSGLIGISFSDTNGNFAARVTANSWQIQSDSAGLAVHGYVGYQNSPVVDTTTGSVVNVTLALPKATALFYGTVKDNLGNPLSGVVAIYANDSNNNLYQVDGFTDDLGNYVTTAVGGLGSNDPWWVSVDNTSSFPNYIFSQPDFDQNGGTNINVGQAVLANFTAILATNHITGNVKFNGTNVIKAGVYASATISGVQYNANMDTDNNGNYSLNVANGMWSVGINQQGGSDSLDNILGPGNYTPPNSQNVGITNNNGTANFTILPGGSGQLFGYIKDTGGNPVANVSVSAQDQSSGQGSGTSTDGNGYYSFGTVSYGTYDLSVDCGGLNSLGYNCLADVITNFASSRVEVDFTAQFTGAALQLTTASLPNGTNGASYNQTFQASGGTPPYNWALASSSANLPANLSLNTNGVLSGTVSVVPATYYFIVEVTDAAFGTNDQTFGLTIVSPPSPPLVITNVSLPNGNVGAVYNAQLGATGGQPTYTWVLALGSANPPPGLTLNSNGLISGTPTTNGLFNFKVQTTDSNSTVTNKVFGIIINPKPVLKQPLRTAGQFQMLLTGASNQNYTVQMSTNLGSGLWSSLFVTNNTTTNSFNVVDPNATNQQRFYRILIGP